ncbi:MAG: AraC family transcriptional regulator, partial [Oscillospiraceae bacterium]|nr:AraC family transcriptional regulator [Oscillospiraceae bacterium]
ALCDILTLFSLQISEAIHSCIQKKNTSTVKKITDYVSSNYSKTITLDSLSEIVELSPNYISTLFYKETGTNFKDYLISVRIDKAKELLKTTQLKIYQIAHSVGYEDARYFGDIFFRIVGCLPSQYRKNDSV